MKIRSTMMISLAAVLAFTAAAQAAKVQDLARIKGAEGGKIIGMGLVFGLNGTGDGGKYAPAMEPLAELIKRRLDSNIVAAHLKDTKNVAVVSLTAEIPGHGVRLGDKIDVHVASIGAAKSLKGGRLFIVPMTGPLPGSNTVYAFAEGHITIEDPSHPTVGVVRKGAEIVEDIHAEYVDSNGLMTLVLGDAFATWPMARNLSDLVNDRMSPDGPEIAMAIDQKNVVVKVPEYELRNPAGFIAEVLQIYIDVESVKTEARVVVNERTGTIIVTGDVEVAPIIISHKDMTITTIVRPDDVPVVDQEVVRREDQWVGFDPGSRGGTKLADLLRAFNQLKVSADDRIAIIKEIERSGKLLGKLIIE